MGELAQNQINWFKEKKMWYTYLLLVVSPLVLVYTFTLNASQKRNPDTSTIPSMIGWFLFPSWIAFCLSLHFQSKGDWILTLKIIQSVIIWSFLADLLSDGRGWIRKAGRFSDKEVIGWVISFRKAQFYKEIGYPKGTYGWNFRHFVSGIKAVDIEVPAKTLYLYARLFIRATAEIGPENFQEESNKAIETVKQMLKAIADGVGLNKEQLESMIAALSYDKKLLIQIQNVRAEPRDPEPVLILKKYDLETS